MEKDTMIKFRSTVRGKNSKGGDRIQLYLTQEEAQSLITTLTNSNGTTGVKLDIHTNKKTTEAGRTFDSSFAFVKQVQEAATRPTGTFTDKPGSDIKSRIAKVKREIA